MRRLLDHFFMCFMGLSIGLYVGCETDDEDSASKEEKLCERLDECDWDVGEIADCAFHVEECTENLAPSEKTDWNNAANDCLGFSSCDLFEDCVSGIDVCGIDFGDGGDGGDGGSDGGDGGECVDTGGVCEENGDCCDWPDTALCVNFGDDGIHCAFICEANGDCQSDCCVPLEESGSVCGPSDLCA